MGSDVGFFCECDDEVEIVGVGADMEVAIEQMLGEVGEVAVCCGERKQIELVEIGGDVKGEFAGQGCKGHGCGGRLDMIVYIPTLLE